MRSRLHSLSSCAGWSVRQIERQATSTPEKMSTSQEHSTTNHSKRIAVRAELKRAHLTRAEIMVAPATKRIATGSYWIAKITAPCVFGQDRDFLKEKGLPLQSIYDPIAKSWPHSGLRLQRSKLELQQPSARDAFPVDSASHVSSLLEVAAPFLNVLRAPVLYVSRIAQIALSCGRLSTRQQGSLCLP